MVNPATKIFKYFCQQSHKEKYTNQYTRQKTLSVPDHTHLKRLHQFIASINTCQVAKTELPLTLPCNIPNPLFQSTIGIAGKGSHTHLKKLNKFVALQPF